METRVRVSKDGKLVIPTSFRKALGVKIGDFVVLRLKNNELRITTLQHRLAEAQRLLREHVKPGISLADELIAERRARGGPS